MLSGGPLMLVVFIALGIAIAIYVISRNVKENQKAISELKETKTKTVQRTASELNTEEEIAAFMALHLYLTQNVHDLESNVLTIERIQRRYSPWSSKIYSVYNDLHR